MASPVGCLLSFLLPNLFFFSDTKENTKWNFELYLYVQTALITLFNIPTWIFLRERPPSPPSYLFYFIVITFQYSVLIKDDDAIQMGIGEGMKELFSNKNYIYLFIVFNFLYGLYSAIASAITSFTTPYDFSPSDNSIICLVFLISGILFSFFIGTILDKYQCYKKSLVGICLGSCFTLSLTFYGLPTRNLMIEAVIMMLTGASIIPIVTICFSLAAELTYPVPEVYSIGIMISAAQIFGCVLVIFRCF